jgi:energy-coupling factor transport system ATP-binding protein
MDVIEINNLYFRYNEYEEYLLKDISLRVKEGEILAITGESGCGKSTLLSIICGIIPHIRKGEIKGEVKLLGENVKDMAIRDISKKIGIVFQDPDSQIFLPTVEDEIAFGPENLMVSRDEIGIRIEKALKSVNMGKYRFENPSNLSGGQKQLIAIASVLAMETDILLFDEIMSQVDEKGKEQIKSTILNLHKEGKTIVIVDHDMDNISLADRVLEIKSGILREFEDDALHRAEGN